MITYDEHKRLSNIEKHGLDFADLDRTFFENALVTPTHSGRFAALGELYGELVVVVIFKPLGTEALSIISMRPASKRERKAL